MIVDLTQSNLQKGLRAFLLTILPSGVEVIVGQDNRVPEPKVVNFVVMTPLNRGRISTSVDTNQDDTLTDQTAPILSGSFLSLEDGVDVPAFAGVKQSTNVQVQLDVHGPNSGDNAQVISTLFRDGYGADAMASYSIAPLYTDDPKQVPFTNENNQVENRWIVMAYIQMNPTVVLPSPGFADQLTVDLINVDTTYPPGEN